MTASVGSMISGSARFSDAEIEWVEGTGAELFDALRGFQLDLIVGGLTTSSPYATEADHPPVRRHRDRDRRSAGEELPDELGGVEIWVERNSAAARCSSRRRKTRSAVVFDHLVRSTARRCFDSWEIDAIDYESTDYILRDDEHAFAVAAGENAFLVELEDFLLDRRQAGRAAARKRRGTRRRRNEIPGRGGASPSAGARQPQGDPAGVDHPRLLGERDRAPLLHPRSVAGDEGGLGRGHPRDLRADLVPVASRYRHREPDGCFPWGYHRSITVAYVVASVALFGLGALHPRRLGRELLVGTHPPIGMVEIFDSRSGSAG